MNRDFKRIALFLMYLAFFGFSMYYYLPEVVFYFDQKPGKGEVTRINEKRVYIDYYHEDLGKKVSISFREGNKLKLKKLEIGKEIQLKYSKKIPSEIFIINYHSSPGIGGLVMIMFFLAPLLLFRWIKH